MIAENTKLFITGDLAYEYLLAVKMEEEDMSHNHD